MTNEPNASKTERAALACTRSEKDALRFVCKVRGTTESELLRVLSLNDVVAEYDRLLAILHAA